MRAIRNFSVFAVLLVFFAACSFDMDFHNSLYTISNESTVSIGIKVKMLESVRPGLSLKDSFLLNPDETVTFYKSGSFIEPHLLFSGIEIFDDKFSAKMRDIDLYDNVIDGDSLNYSVILPFPGTAEIVDNSRNVYVYMDGSSLFGFCPKSDALVQMSYFRTYDYFESVSYSALPKGTQYYLLNRKFTDKIIAYDSDAYADTSLMLISGDNGDTWSTLISYVNSSSQDFLGCDFISENKGWFFIFSDASNTLVYRYEDSVYQYVSTLPGYCLRECRFLDENTGYIVVNSANAVSPSDKNDAFFMKTTDGGASWSSPVEISAVLNSGRMFVPDPDKIVVVPSLSSGFQDFIYVSNDGGSDWEQQQIDIDSIHVRDIYFVSPSIAYMKSGTSTGWSFSNAGYVYKSTDGGLNWTLMTRTKMFGSSISFFDENNGYMQDLIYGKGQVLNVTRDGGVTWREVLYPYDYILND